jgi:hypothetical protein
LLTLDMKMCGAIRICAQLSKWDMPADKGPSPMDGSVQAAGDMPAWHRGPEGAGAAADADTEDGESHVMCVADWQHRGAPFDPDR